MASRKSRPSADARPAVWIPSHIFCFGLLTALTALTYANSLQGKFVFDDLELIQQNSSLMNVRTVGDVVSVAAREASRQLLFLSYGLNYYWGGLHTFGYHAVNVALHTVNVLFVYGIILAALREDERSRYVALGGAAIVAVHTLLSGAVSYIAGRAPVF